MRQCERTADDDACYSRCSEDAGCITASFDENTGNCYEYCDCCNDAGFKRRRGLRRKGTVLDVPEGMVVKPF